MGTLQFIGTGAAGAFPASNPADKLIDLVQSLRSPYRQGAVFVMNSATAAAIRKFKTADGAFMFQPSLAAGQPATLLGYPLIEAEDMPDIAAGSLSIAFGNFKAGYVIAERNATTILRDPYTHKPYVHFYATQTLDMLVGGASRSRRGRPASVACAWRLLHRRERAQPTPGRGSHNVSRHGRAAAGASSRRSKA